MRNPNQINNARRRETDAQGKRRVDGEAGYTHTSHGGNGHVSREGGRNNRSILRVSGEQLGAA